MPLQRRRRISHQPPRLFASTFPPGRGGRTWRRTDCRQCNTSSVMSGGQVALFATTVNQQATARNPELEQQIVTQVASYGKQLGR